jgi:hypothetical protein
MDHVEKRSGAGNFADVSVPLYLKTGLRKNLEPSRHSISVLM